MRTIDGSPAVKPTAVGEQAAEDQDYWSLIGPISLKTSCGQLGLVTNKTSPAGIIKVKCEVSAKADSKLRYLIKQPICHVVRRGITKKKIELQ